MKRFLSFALRHSVQGLWAIAFSAAAYVLLWHRPGTMPNQHTAQNINEWIVETTPLRNLFGQLERDLESGSITLRQAIDVAESYVDDTLMKEALNDFGGSNTREKLSHMMVLWIIRRSESNPSADLRARIADLKAQHMELYPYSAAPPACRL